jgi:hypothetical protein
MRIFVAPLALDDDRTPPEPWAMEAVAVRMQSRDTIYHRVGADLLLVGRPQERETAPTK